MAHTQKTHGIIGAILSLFWLAACSSPTATSTPTLDMNPLRTEVAATVLAQVTQALAQTPTITPLPSPTATLRPTSTPLAAASVTPAPSNGTATPSSATPAPSSATAAASGATPTAGDNRAQWISQTIADDTLFTPGETFTMTWRLKNVGITTWKTGYMLRFYSGETFGAPKEVLLSSEVPPGEMVDITLVMKAPTRPGTYGSVWVMSTEKRSNFKEPVYLQIKVATPATPTPTP